MRRTIQELYDVRQRQQARVLEEARSIDELRRTGPATGTTTTKTTIYPDGRVEEVTTSVHPPLRMGRCIFHPWKHCWDVLMDPGDWCAHCVRERLECGPCRVVCHRP